jgi:hypothetical protein
MRMRCEKRKPFRGGTMSKKSFIDSVGVKSPCTEDWSQMQGNERVRFCSHCSKSVSNLSEMSRKEAMHLVRSSNGNLCIRYIANPVTKRPLFADQLLQITRRTPGLAAGVISASLSLSTLTYAQEEAPSPIPTDEPSAITLNQENTYATDNDNAQPETDEVDNDEGSIEGTIWDSDGKPVPEVTINLFNAESSAHVGYETTDRNGHYLFKELEPGVYLMRIYSANGLFKKAMPEITLAGGQKSVHNLHVTLVEPAIVDGEGSGSGWGGAMATVPYSLPLSEAVGENNFELVLDLIANGAKVNDKDTNYDDITPLFLAVENGNLQMVKLLLNKGADVNAKDNTKRTPIMFIDEDATPALIDLLIRAGAKVNGKDKNGNTVLLQTISSINVDVLTALISSGVDVNKADDDDDTPLIKAAEANKLELIKELILAGAEVNARNKNGESAWDKTSNLEIEKYLEEYGAVIVFGDITIEKRSPQQEDESADALKD